MADKRKFVDQFDLAADGQCDRFTATRGDWKPGCLVGVGDTPEEAQADLGRQEREEEEARTLCFGGPVHTEVVDPRKP